jgi:competence protein ComEC
VLWAAIAVPLVAVGAAIVIAIVVAARIRVTALVVPLLVVGAAIGALADARAEATRAAVVPSGRVTLHAIALTDPAPGFRPVAVVKPVAADGVAWSGPPLLLVAPPADLAVGEPVEVVGIIDPDPDRYRGSAIAGVVTGRSVRLGPAPNPFLRFGNALRDVVLGHLDEARVEPAGALLAGFLIGDTTALPDRDSRALRLAGLSHYVAVSGSNVALFLAAWWVVGGPLGLGPRRRAAFGMVGLVVFAVVTRWEPSVIRASVMAGLVLLGRFTGRPITPWTALGGAVGLSLLVAPELAGSVGFALSVAATGGIILGAPIWAGRQPAPAWTVLGATVSAQLAVAPLLLVWFGSIPLMAPLANLLAAPVVAASTALGGVGAVFGVDWLVGIGTSAAGVVLAIARTTADLPQLGVGVSLLTGAAGLLALRARWLRPVLAGGVALAVVLSIAPPGPPSVATVYFLDVGQGDATLFRGPGSETILIDGGPDPEVLRGHLRRYGVGRIDLLVITHLHADHSTGLRGLADSVSVGVVWHPPQEGGGGAFDLVLSEMRARGARVGSPFPGDVVVIGSLRVEAVAPIRRYAGPNDGSIAMLVSEPGGATVVMSGDIEVAAQRDLGPLRGEIMKVPHQGAATSDLEWLAASAPDVAVISVGPNDYGHPSPEVVAVLEEAGAIVLRTDRDGTITLPMAGAMIAAAALPSGS